jgi:hypothetical protein
MHATLALCLMMVSGPVAPGPEPEIVNVPLNVDAASPGAMQELEWKANTQQRRTLARVPTLITDDSRRADGRVPSGRYAPPTDRNGARGQQPGGQQAGLPTSPTDPGNMAGGTPNGPMPLLPGAGGGQGYGGQGYGGQGYAQDRPTTYSPNGVSGRAVSNMGAAGTQTAAPGAIGAPRASDTLSGIYGNANMSYLGVSSNPMLNTSVGGAPKPFSDYQRPSGYSPWMSLYNTPTNNGTVSTYASSVQPQIQQQQYNRQMAEQIQGVRNTIMSPQAGSTPGMEMPVSGAGLVNPNAVINYGFTPQR